MSLPSVMVKVPEVRPAADTNAAFNSVMLVTVVIWNFRQGNADQRPVNSRGTLKHSAPLHIIGTNEADKL